MLTRFEVENYKNFKDRIILDFRDSGGYQFNTDCLYDSILSKIMIYGRNASGKTNLGSALLDICNYPFYRRSEQIFINADTENATAKFRYCFEFNNDLVDYLYEKDAKSNYVSEELRVNDALVYSIDYTNRIITSGDLSLVSVETIIVDRFFSYWENKEKEIVQNNSPSFLRWIVANSTLEDTSVLILMVMFIDKMQFVTVGNSMSPKYLSYVVQQYDNEYVKELDRFLNQMGVECKLVLKKLPEGEKQLYFNYKKPIPFFGNASSGTIALFNLYARIIARAKHASLIYLDEFDAFYHYEMAENIMRFLKKNYPETQIIITTHNTNLMTNRLSRPDCLFILSTSGKLTSLNNATTRELREGHNLEKLYISGEFEEYE